MKVVRNKVIDIDKKPEEQASFRAERSSVDNLSSLKVALEKIMQRN